jgi:hypothetical protein
VTHPAAFPARLSAIVIAGTMLLAAAACGGGNDDAPNAAETTAATAPSDDSGNGANAGPSGDDDPANPLVLGYQVAGEPGTELELEVVAVADGVEQQAMDQRPILRDEPFWILLSTFVDSATITISVTEGESATLEVFYGRAVNPDNPTLGVEIVEPIETIEVGNVPVSVEIP